MNLGVVAKIVDAPLQSTDNNVEHGKSIRGMRGTNGDNRGISLIISLKIIK